MYNLYYLLPGVCVCVCVWYSVASWQSPDDLSGVTPMDTGRGEWTTVSESRTDTTPSPPQGNWADFSSFPTHNNQSPQ